MSDVKKSNQPISLEEKRCQNPKCNHLFFKIKGAIIGLLDVKCDKCKLHTVFKK